VIKDVDFQASISYNAGNMKPKEVVVGSFYRNSKYPDLLYKGVLAPDGRLTFKIVKGEEMLGKYVVYDEDIPLNMDFWNLFTLTTVESLDSEPEPEPEPNKPRTEKKAIIVPLVEFSVTELAAQNNVEYSAAFVFVKEQVAAGTVKPTRKERRAARGKETQLYQKI